ncbi:hypothetical protein SDC9_155860 [bioreactor metagenome]|uniref:Uncharacterized protein n=1 Tax=bioreactor metagenome TaxID=1076179 RepID=A0A645F2X5_9ZZZZ
MAEPAGSGLSGRCSGLQRSPRNRRLVVPHRLPRGHSGGRGHHRATQRAAEPAAVGVERRPAAGIRRRLLVGRGGRAPGAAAHPRRAGQCARCYRSAAVRRGDRVGPAARPTAERRWPVPSELRRQRAGAGVARPGERTDDQRPGGPWTVRFGRSGSGRGVREGGPRPAVGDLAGRSPDGSITAGRGALRRLGR